MSVLVSSVSFGSIIRALPMVSKLSIKVSKLSIEIRKDLEYNIITIKLRQIFLDCRDVIWLQKFPLTNGCQYYTI